MLYIFFLNYRTKITEEPTSKILKIQRRIKNGMNLSDNDFIKPEEFQLEEPFPMRQSLFYGVGKFGWVLISGFYGFLVYFYHIKVGLGWEYISLAFMIYAIWNAINDPIFGIMSDRTHHKLGRRIPYIRYGAPFLAISLIVLWIPLVSASNQLGLFFYLLLGLFFYDTFFTLVVICYISLIGELALTAKNRTKISFVSGTISGVAGAITTVLPPLFLYTDQPLQSPIDPFQIFIIIAGIVGFALIYLSSFFLKEKPVFSREEQLGFKDSIKFTIKNKPFLILEIIIFGTTFLGSFVMINVSYYIDYVLDLEGGLAILPILLFLLANLVGSIFFTALTGKMGIKKSLILSMPITIAGLLMLFFTQTLEQTIMPVLIAGFGIAAMYLFTDPLIVDIADFDELRSGRRREASFFGVNALITKPAESIAVWVLTGLFALFSFVQPLIDSEGHAIPQPQPPEAIFGIKFLMSIFPAIILGLLLIALYFYPLDGPKYKEMKFKVQQLHEEKEKRLLEKLRGVTTTGLNAIEEEKNN